MIYTTGSIAVSGNTLTGTGTNFTQAGSLIRNGCTVLALTSPVQAFQITAINSATSLTVTPAASPAVPAGTKFAILLSDSLSVDGLAQDIAETFTMYQRYMGGFADVMNGASDVTITINGQVVTVPGQMSLAKKGANSDITSLSGLTSALSVEQGGTGAKNKADARMALSAASSGANSDITSLSGLTTALSIAQGGTGATSVSGARGALGIGAAASLGDALAAGAVLKREPGNVNTTLNNPTAIFNWLRSVGFGSYQFTAAQAGAIIRYYPTFYFNAGNLHALLQSNYSTGELISWGAVDNGGSWSFAQNILYGTANTTKGSDGTIKAASPVARIVQSQEACQRADVDDDGFMWCGCGTANREAEGITISRLDTGVYTLTGSAGLASSGWQLLPPRDPQGSGDMGIVEAEQAEDGSLIIRLYKRRYVLSDDGDIELQKGVAIDVPPTSWIDVRLDMPENSIWNQHAERAQDE